MSINLEDDQQVRMEIERLRSICRTTHKGAPKGRYYYMTDFEPYDSMFEDVPRCPQCEIVDNASRRLRELEDKYIEKQWQQRGGGVICGKNPRDLTTEYKTFLNEIGAERYDGCSRRTTNFSGKADKSRYIGSPNQPDPHLVDESLRVKDTSGKPYWWEGTNDPLAWTADMALSQKDHKQSSTTTNNSSIATNSVSSQSKVELEAKNT